MHLNRILLLLCTVICVFNSHSLVPTIAVPFKRSTYYILMHGISLLWIPKQQQFCVSLIPKWDTRITNFPILDLGIENLIQGLQTLQSLHLDIYRVWRTATMLILHDMLTTTLCHHFDKVGACGSACLCQVK